MTTERQTPQHMLGIGPWAEGIKWKAQPNFGLSYENIYPSLPLLAVPGLVSMGFTLRRDGSSEATVECDMPRGSAVLFEEMVTDLWWRRWEPTTNSTEPINRFQARDVSLTRTGDRVRTAVTLTDYRAVIEDRVYTTSFNYAAGTAAMTILGDIIPNNTGASTEEFAAYPNNHLGNITEPMDVEAGQTVGDLIEALRPITKGGFDWGCELPDSGTYPHLLIWPGSRGEDNSITLVDTGTGYTPISSWDRNVNTEDYANMVWFMGRDHSQIAALSVEAIGGLPMGVRMARGSNPNLIQASHIAAAATKELAKRSVLTGSWRITLVPGFWRGRSHIDVGDWIRVVVQLGQLRLDERHQVEEIDVKIAASGVEEVTLTLGNARVSPNPKSRYSFASRIIKRIYNVARP